MSKNNNRVSFNWSEIVASISTHGRAFKITERSIEVHGQQQSEPEKVEASANVQEKLLLEREVDSPMVFNTVSTPKVSWGLNPTKNLASNQDFLNTPDVPTVKKNTKLTERPPFCPYSRLPKKGVGKEINEKLRVFESRPNSAIKDTTTKGDRNSTIN